MDKKISNFFFLCFSEVTQADIMKEINLQKKATKNKKFHQSVLLKF